MYSLLIDTHAKIINIVLYKDGKMVKKDSKETLKSHSIYVMPMIRDLLQDCGVDKKEIKELIVVNGPGSFTGIRLGITIAKTWAYAKKIKIKAISSLQMLACSLNKDIKKVAISDPKGYYVGVFASNNKLLEDYKYIASKDLKDYKKEEDIEIDYNAVYEFISYLPALNPHAVNPLYIKKIEVEK